MSYPSEDPQVDTKEGAPHLPVHTEDSKFHFFFQRVYHFFSPLKKNFPYHNKFLSHQVHNISTPHFSEAKTHPTRIRLTFQWGKKR